jgi:hypothetical protein
MKEQTIIEWLRGVYDPFEEFVNNGEACRFCFARKGREHRESCIWTIARAVSPLPASAAGRAPDVAVAGRMERTIADFERACLVHLADEQRRPNPDNALIAVLCDAVRLSREQGKGCLDPPRSKG